MARIELRDATIRLKDGLAGTAKISANAAVNDTNINVDTIVLNTTDTDLIPIGARLTVNSANNTGTYIVTARTPADVNGVSTSPTTNVTVSPIWTGGASVVNDVVTFHAQELEIKIGDGNLKYSENKNYDYLLDRGDLDTVREGDEKPIDVDLQFVYEHVTTGTSESMSPVDALKKIGAADEWVSSSADLCEPYCVDLEIEQVQPCGTNQDETTLLPDFRYEKLDFSLKDATISVSGKCMASSAIVTRG
jgi:hypothetical protein